MEPYFAKPEWVSLLWLVVAVVSLLVWLDVRGSAQLDVLLSRVMQQRLVRRASRFQRWTGIGLLGMSGVCLVLAVMQPQWGQTYEPMNKAGAQIMVCLDVSKSMLAEDTIPNRLERAKAEVSDLLDYLEGDQVGLIGFAGKATVLCPITPDYGFFRLVLDDAGPHSVGLGGTRLEEPIEKALAGFRGESEASRVILLITDGEDHDSLPLDAAKKAKEGGIKVIAIGFGDEDGSPIEYTDPSNGARVVVKDQAGETVISRLDGETLREIALATEGVYVPAGTGALDLESIYDAHISPLVRGTLDDRGRMVSHEAFQWPVLGGILFLLLAAAAQGGPVRTPFASISEVATPIAKKVAVWWLITVLVLGPAMQSVAQDTVDPSKAKGSEASNQNEAKSEPTDEDSVEEPTDPRELYNNALAFLKADPDKADELLGDARRNAGANGEIRFRASYNMGWVEVARADANLKEKPEEALKHLRASADWFRDAIKLRPDSNDSRHNLEVVMRRALQLADSLAKKDDKDLAARVDELIERQRALLTSGRELVQQLAGKEDIADETTRKSFHRLATEQRKIVSDTEALARSAGEQLDSLKSKGEELKPEERLRQVQIDNLLSYVNRGVQRMAQARSQWRRRQGQRGYRRASISLSELKRARDQLRNPVEILGIIRADAMPVVDYTRAMAASQQVGVVAAEDRPTLPAWITKEYLQESQLSITERTEELAERLEAGAQLPATPTDQTDSQPQDPQQEFFMQMVREAAPLVSKGRDAFLKADEQLADDKLLLANDTQIEAILALDEARELFLDLKRLIELTYQTEMQIGQVLAAVEQVPAGRESEFYESIEREQKRNALRGVRLEKLLKLEEASAQQTPTAGQAPGAGAADPKAAEQRKERFTQAELLRSQAVDAMNKAIEYLQKGSESSKEGDEPDDPDGSDEGDDTEGDDVESDKGVESHEEIMGAVAEAIVHLRDLRRLFFSITEHLQETVQRQTQLNDETEEVRALEESDKLEQKTAPLLPRQSELGVISQQISGALQEQAAAGNQAPQGAQPQTQRGQPTAEQFRQASDLVAAAKQAMDQVSTELVKSPPEMEPARKNQDKALRQLTEALQLLQPPQDQDNDQDQQQNQQQDQPQNQPNQGQKEKQPQQQSVDPTSALQAVRDREAKRRKEKEQAARIYASGVEKDW